MINGKDKIFSTPPLMDRYCRVLDTAWQYNVSDRQVKRYSIGTRYQPEPGKVLNAAYRYNRDSNCAGQTSGWLSGQWPISGRWRTVGRQLLVQGRWNRAFNGEQPELGA